jgi:hypothetical protein
MIGAGLALCAGPAFACSLRGAWGGRDTTTLSLIASFRADTVFAGPGAMRPENALGHFGRGNRASIFGQLATIVEVPSRTARALPAGARTVVFVPWDYASECSPVPWNRSAAWITPGTEGLISARLRAREHWVEGMPTFDVTFPQRQPYNPASSALGGSDSIARTALGPRQLMHLLDSLPPRTAVIDTLAERQVIVRLAGDSTLNDRYPIPALIGDARYALGQARIRTIRAPFTGTLRFDISVNRGPWRTMWARTGSAAMGGYASDAARRVQAPKQLAQAPDLLAPVWYEAHSHYLRFAAALDSLPIRCGEQRASVSQGYVYVPVHRADAHLSRGRWMMHAEGKVFSTVLTPSEQAGADSAFRAWLGSTAQWKPTYDIRVKRSRRGGPARFSGVTTLAGVGQLRVRGVQVDTNAVQCGLPGW